jgi:putative transposase
MPRRLHRYFGAGYSHFVTSSCCQRRPLLASAHRRNLFLEILEQVRRRYAFVVVGYVVMPKHFHLLISEPERGNPSTVVQVLKQRFARAVLRKQRKAKSPAQGCSWNDALDAGHL